MVPQLTDLREEILRVFHCSRFDDVPRSSLLVLLKRNEVTH